MDPDDANQVVDAVMSCVGDHFYDRNPDGIPNGLDENLHLAFSEVVKRCIRQYAPEWDTRTRGFSPKIQRELRRDLKTALEARNDA